jgi:hypothetical protein
VGNSPLRVNNKSAINCNKNANTIAFIRITLSKSSKVRIIIIIENKLGKKPYNSRTKLLFLKSQLYAPINVKIIQAIKIDTSKIKVMSRISMK